MRVVVYDAEDMEPITVITLEQKWVERLGRDRQITMAVMPRLSFYSFEQRPDWDQVIRVSHCRLSFEPIMKGGKLMMWVCTTMDGESALLLRSVFLPGQQSAVSRERESAFMQGLMMAIDGR